MHVEPLISGDNVTVLRDSIMDERVGLMRLRERAVQLPARRDDAFKRAAREEDAGRQGALDL